MHTIGEFLSDERTLALSQESWRRHLHLIGATGTGKSTLLFNLMCDDLEAGRGFALLDPHGDLSQMIADAAPSHRNDILYLDPSDLSYPVGFNVLTSLPEDMRALVAAQVIASFKAIWSDSWGSRLEYILSNGIRLLLDGRGSTLLGLPRLLSDETYRNNLLAHCTDPVVRHFWRDEFGGWSERFRQEAIAALQNKIGALLSAPAIRNIIGQTHDEPAAGGPRQCRHDRFLPDRRRGRQNHRPRACARNPSALTDTPNFHAWVKLINGGVPSEARMFRTHAPNPATGRIGAIRARTRARHARPRAKVESAIRVFLDAA